MAFSDADILAVWRKGSTVDTVDGMEWRKDACGAWMGFKYYGDRNSRYGWEVDHVDPSGGDALSNLQPLQWENNVAKGDGKKLVCVVTSQGNKNVSK